MNNRTWVENMIWSVIALNFVVLMYMFLIPRLQLMASHWGMESEALMEISGAKDIPNQYIKTYKVVNQIRKTIENDSIVLIPPDNWGFVPNKSVLIQRLYPRKVYFSGDEDFSQQMKIIDIEQPVYGVVSSSDGADFCFEKDIESLGETGLIICKWNFSG
jgi:hypothetical protein